MNSPETEYTKDSVMVTQQQKKETKPHKTSISVASTDPPLFA